MAESAEHRFLSQCITNTLAQLSQSNLYAYAEAERRKFDFACELKRDWSAHSSGKRSGVTQLGLTKIYALCS
jgi:hypothetical protein